MGDQTYACITIGGRLDPHKVQALAQVIHDQNLYALDDSTPVGSPAQVLAALERFAAEGLPAEFDNTKVNYGMFDELEAFCVELGLDFKRVNSSGDAYPEGARRVIPGEMDDSRMTSEGDPVLTLPMLRAFMDAGTLRQEIESMERFISNPPPLVIAGPLTALVEQAERQRAGSN